MSHYYALSDEKLESLIEYLEWFIQHLETRHKLQLVHTREQYQELLNERIRRTKGQTQ